MGPGSEDPHEAPRSDHHLGTAPTPDLDDPTDPSGRAAPPADTPEGSAYLTGVRMATEDVIGADFYVHLGAMPAHLMTPEENEAAEQMDYETWRRWWYRGWSTTYARRGEEEL